MRRRHEERPRALRRGPAPAWLACWVCGWALARGAAGADDEAFDPARFEVVPLLAGLRQPMRPFSWAVVTVTSPTSRGAVSPRGRQRSRPSKSIQ